MARCRYRPAISGSILELVGELRAVDQQLLGHAAPDHAGPADAKILANTDARAVARRDARGANAARAGANHKQVVVISHVDTLRTKPQHGHNSVAGETISALRRPGKGNGACISSS